MQSSIFRNSQTLSWEFYRLSVPVRKCSAKNLLFLTKNCVQKLREIESKGALMRVLVDSGGCSGFQYKFQLVDKIQETDEIIKQEGASVVIDSVSRDLIKGSTIDYEDELIRSGFCIINNPQVDKSCSCGVSFSPKPD
ncbi:Iron-sulfur cluster assembly 2 [Schistosoma japonicum]|uniref:Iron-sulfur cluster assembly 2 homolog, mitochondrial n=1 Tax=Schistosoma japonicum TaxID=6182 RepID=Q5DAZ5_SCHJA|nr:SJCHGC05455 protein [Schistosoma japonicum]TNN19869.1 Iron-sulfur cluster assembly 2 [Schistosoma japonicum]